MSRRRFLILFVLSLLATLASAWVPATFTFRGSLSESGWMSEDDSSNRDIGVFGTYLGHLEFAENIEEIRMFDPPRLRQEINQQPMTERCPTLGSSGGLDWKSFNATEWGFPMKCLWLWRMEERSTTKAKPPSPTRRTARGEIPLASALGGDHSLPYLPIWFGLMTNTVFYFAAFNILIAARSTVLSALRRRHNLCPHCTYDLRATPAGLPCPECGAPAT